MSHRENPKPEAGLSRENLGTPHLLTDEGEAVSGVIGATIADAVQAGQRKAAANAFNALSSKPPRLYRCRGCGSTSDPCECSTHGV